MSRESLILPGLILVAAMAITFTLYLLLGLAPAVAVLGGTGLGALPWAYASISRQLKSRERARAYLRMVDLMTGRVRVVLSALVSNNPNRDYPRDMSLWASELDSTDLIHMAASSVTMNAFESETVERLGSEVVSHLIIHLSVNSLSLQLGRDARAELSSYVGAQIEFSRDGPTLSDEGKSLAKAVIFLREHGSISDPAAFWKFFDSQISDAEQRSIAVELSDPSLGFMIYDMGKSDDLMDLVRRRMSGSRVLRQLSTHMSINQAIEQRNYGTFLVLKEEMGHGARYIKSEIDKVTSRVSSSGRLYYPTGSSGYQSVSLLSRSKRYKDAKAFVEDTFPGLSTLQGRESQRAALVAVPLVTNQAYYFPEDESILDPAHFEHYHKWTLLLGKDREVYRGFLADFELSFIDVIQFLTLDFLVKGILASEKNYLRTRSDKVLAVLHCPTLLEVSEVDPERLAATLRNTGYPSYLHSELKGFIDSYATTLRAFLNERVLALATQIVSNAKQIRNLQSKPQIVRREQARDLRSVE
jgi:hypothetical protein